MQFEISLCPYCAEPADYVLETVLACIDRNEEDGSYEYTGDTDNNEQIMYSDSDGKHRLWCPNGHVWSTAMKSAEKET